MEISQKSEKKELPYGPAIPFLDIYISERYSHLNVGSSIIYSCRDMEES